ncbi:hypothetical protein [Natrarchaeobaculum sulfurireducens]|uniref:ABC-2 type transport system permease protein n=1 Tax=Natrarchaeobaculum sulfurireducens TaxID=2044521 RepID=A0A346PKD9_9EURY|nr:hypothetical protein [Natrarchaeobaculum sulfurireducens]AXR79984.1 hypothetical protein AArcMg_4159 [Natrarchaeobaculum sulfurireducens]
MFQWTLLSTIAITELRRRWRALTSNTVQLVASVVVLVVFLPFSLVGLAGVFFFGAAIGSGEIETPLEWIQMAFVYGWIGVAGLGGYRAYSIALRPDNADGLLTTVSHRELVGGLVVAELLLWGVPAVVFGAAVSLVFAIGLGSPLATPFILLTICVVLVTALVTGFIVALAVRNSGVRSKFLTRIRTVLLAGAAIAYLWLIVTQNLVSVFDPIYQVLSPTPVGWYGDLATIGTKVDGSALRAGGSLVISGVLLAAAIPVLYRLAEWLWYADGVSIEHDRSVERTESRRSRLTGIVPAPLLGVIQVDWKRARRAPVMLSFTLYPLIILIGPITTAVQTGTVGRSLPLWVLLSGIWITGSLFALNILGAEGATLPVTLLGAVPGRALVGGHAVASALLGTPITVGAVIVLVILSPHQSTALVTFSFSALILAAGSGFIATGIGTVFPRFEAVSVSRSTKAIVPSKTAFAVYSVVILLVTLPTILGHSAIVSHWLTSVFGVHEIVINAAGAIFSALLVVLFGSISTYIAIHRVESYRFE